MDAFKRKLAAKVGRVEGLKVAGKKSTSERREGKDAKKRRASLGGRPAGFAVYVPRIPDPTQNHPPSKRAPNGADEEKTGAKGFYGATTGVDAPNRESVHEAMAHVVVVDVGGWWFGTTGNSPRLRIISDRRACLALGCFLSQLIRSSATGGRAIGWPGRFT